MDSFFILNSFAFTSILFFIAFAGFEKKPKNSIKVAPVTNMIQINKIKKAIINAPVTPQPHTKGAPKIAPSRPEVLLNFPFENSSNMYLNQLSTTVLLYLKEKINISESKKTTPTEETINFVFLILSMLFFACQTATIPISIGIATEQIPKMENTKLCMLSQIFSPGIKTKDISATDNAKSITVSMGFFSFFEAAFLAAFLYISTLFFFFILNLSLKRGMSKNIHSVNIFYYSDDNRCQAYHESIYDKNYHFIGFQKPFK